MGNQQAVNYQRIEKAIIYILQHFKQQPSLEELAGVVHLSPYHFQRLFTAWAGVSPKKFMQYTSVEYAKTLLKNRASLADAANQTGLSGASRLHDLFITIEGMTPAEFKHGGKSLTIDYSFAHTHFGSVIIASTTKGICHIHFDEDRESALTYLQSRFPQASYDYTHAQLHKDALDIFNGDWHSPDTLRLHLAGTPFQLKVWESLLKIPSATLTSYGDIATAIGKPSASRAVGNAIGSNPIAFLIPCHRVIQSSGKLGGYMWGSDKKRTLQAWEAAQKDKANG